MSFFAASVQPDNLPSTSREEYVFLFGNSLPTTPLAHSENRSILAPGASLGFFTTEIDSATFLKTASGVAGLATINSLAMPFMLKDTYHITPAALSLLGVGVAFPSFLKPFYAVMIDNLKIGGLRRKPYLFIANSIDIVSRIIIGILASHGYSFALVSTLLIMHSAAGALDSTIRDTLLMETSAISSSPANLISDISFISSATALSVSYFSGALLSLLSPSTVILASSLLPTMQLANIYRLKEEETQETNSSPLKIEDLLSILKSNEVLKSQATSASIGACVPNFNDAMFYFYTEKLKLGPEFFGRFRLVGCVASMVTNTVYRTFLTNVDQSRLSIGASVAAIPIIGTALFITTGNCERFFHISTTSFMLIRHSIYEGLATLSILPSLVSLSKLAPMGKRGPFFSMFGAVSDASNVANGIVSAAAIRIFGVTSTNFSNLTPLVSFCTAMNVITSPWTVWSPSTEDANPESHVEIAIDQEEVINSPEVVPSAS